VRVMDEEKFEVLAEWTIRKLKDIETKDKDKIIRWVLYSLGVKDVGADIYLYLREKKRATTTEIADRFSISPTTARRYLEQLHSLGLVDYIGREYHITREDLSGCIREILIPRIRRVLYDIAETARYAEQPKYEGKVYGPEKLRERIMEAKEEAMRNISRLLEKGVKITPDIISGVLEKTFDAIGKLMEDIGRSLEKMGQHMYIYTYTTPESAEDRKKTVIRIDIPERQKKRQHVDYTRGLSIMETRDRIIYNIYSDYRLTVKDFEYARDVNKKMLIKVYGSLEIDPSVGAGYEECIEKIIVYGVLEASKEFIDAVRDKLIVYGHVDRI